MSKSKINSIWHHRVYEYYYDFCFVYERICDMLQDVLCTDKKSNKLFEYLGDEGYPFINCLGMYVSKRYKGSKRDRVLIFKGDYYTLLPKSMWQDISDLVESYCNGIDHPYQDMMSDCFASIFENKFKDLASEGQTTTKDIKRVCKGCINEIKCQLETR